MAEYTVLSQDRSGPPSREVKVSFGEMQHQDGLALHDPGCEIHRDGMSVGYLEFPVPEPEEEIPGKQTVSLFYHTRNLICVTARLRVCGKYEDSWQKGVQEWCLEMERESYNWDRTA